jgi:peroxin-10
MFEVSAQPDIVRAFQKDAFYEQILCEDVQELLDLAFGGVAVRVQPHIRTVSSFIYYLQSTGHGNRTLGEEYCDILQVCGYSKPGLVRRLAMVVIHVFGPFILENPRRIRIPGSISEMIVQYKDVFEQLSKLHLALFYLYGVYYHISKRLTSIRYVCFLVFSFWI